MSNPEVEVTFEPEGRRVRVPAGTELLRAAVQAGISLEMPCGGQGICGKCKVVFTQGMVEPNPDDRQHLTAQELARGLRLACQHRIWQDVAVFIPESSRSLVQQILSRGRGREVAVRPGVQKVPVHVPRPSLEDQRDDYERLRAALGIDAPLETPRTVLASLPETLRRADFAVTAVLSAGRLLALERGDTSAELYGLAMDIGTTTVVVYLLDLRTGQQLAVAAGMNAQMAYGDDVVSRIRHAMQGRRARRQLQRAVIRVLNDLIRQAARSAGVSLQRVYLLTAVGNTCMMHLFLGLDPTPLGLAPYVPVVRQPWEVAAQELGLRVNPQARVYVLPNIASFVGADTVGMVLTHLWGGEGTALAIDIGTNGEIVLRHRGRIMACSAAAGPAFEGARITHGMRGAPGAISRVRLNEQVEIDTIGHRPPQGICGSGLVDVIAQMLERGLLDSTGRIAAPEEVPQVSDELRSRLVTSDSNQAFVLARAEESATGEPVVLSQRDVRELQLAKGSIRAATNTLLKTVGVELEEIERLYLAGGFGNYLDIANARRIGLLPPLPLERIEGVGNAAGAGAKLALLSVEERRRAAELARQVEHLELCGNPDYQMEFMETMLFPEPDA